MGLVYALGAYLSWGLVVPVHFRLLSGFSPSHILAVRILWSCLFAVLLALLWRRRVRSPFPLRRRHALLVASAGLIGVNWLLYLQAVNSGHLLDASLGYYINPLVSVALGAVVLRERLRPLQVVAVAIAAAGVALAVALAGSLPVLALELAVSFALYGLVRKVVGIDPVVGFLAETLILMPAAARLGAAVAGTGAAFRSEGFHAAGPDGGHDRRAADLVRGRRRTPAPRDAGADAVHRADGPDGFERPRLRRADRGARDPDVRPDLAGAGALRLRLGARRANRAASRRGRRGRRAAIIDVACMMAPAGLAPRAPRGKTVRVLR